MKNNKTKRGVYAPERREAKVKMESLRAASTPAHCAPREGGMAAIQWGPWSGAVRGSNNGLPAVPPPVVPASDLIVLQKMILSMLTDPSLSDVCLVVEGKDVPAHKAVLAAWSRPFRAMFTLPMLESQHQCRVVIEDVEHSHLMVVLQYVYGGRIGLTDQNVVPVSALANRYEVLPLMAQCEDYMKWRLKPSNVCQQLLAAEEHHVPKAMDVALEYLAVHFDEVQHEPLGGDFNSLGGETVLRMLQHDGLTADEETVFLAVDGWAKAWKCRNATRGAATNFAIFGRSPPPAVAEQQSRQTPGVGSTNRSSSSSHSVKKTLSAGDLPPSEKSPSRNARDARRQRGGSGCWSGGPDTERSLLERQKGDNHKGCTDGESTAAPLPVKATAAAEVSQATVAATAAGAAAEARRTAEEEGQAGKPLAPAAAAAAAAAASATSTGGPNGISRSTNATDVTVAPSSSDPSCSAYPALSFTSGTISAVGAGGVGRGRNTECLSAPVVGEDSRKGAVGETVRGVLQRRASVSTGGKERQGEWAGGMAGRPASFSHPPPPPESSAVIRDPSSSGPVDIDVSVGAGEEAMASMPDEERAFMDELLMEIRFPLISTSFLCQVVEKSPAITGSKVAQRLLLEAYRFQAMTSTDAVDVDEHFPGNHRVKFRGHERVLFGEGDACVGTVEDFSSSLSEVHLVENVKRKDDKYWLPGQPEEAYFCVRLDRVRRLTKVRFQNRYSEEFEVAVRRTRKEEWQVIVPRQKSGGHKDVTEIDLTRKRVNARHVKISLRGRKRSCYNTSCYWTELLGF